MAEKPKHGEWIDINEKFPPNYGGQDVLVYSSRAYSPIDVKTFYGNGEGGGKFQKGWNKGESKYEVTHWTNGDAPTWSQRQTCSGCSPKHTRLRIGQH